MKLCENHDDGTYCLYCGECGMVLCREHSGSECTYCGHCEEGMGITLD